jgi:hypothetical protein
MSSFQLNASQINMMSSSTFSGLTGADIGGIAPVEFAKVDEAHLRLISKTQAPSINAAQLNSLTGSQLAKLGNIQLPPFLNNSSFIYISVNAFSGMDDTHIGYLNTFTINVSGGQLNSLRQREFNLLSGNFFANMSATAFVNLDNTHLAYITAEQARDIRGACLNGLSKVQVNQLSLNALRNLSTSAFGSLDNTHLGYLLTQLPEVFTADWLNKLSKSDFQNLSSNIINNLTVGAFKKLDNFHLGYLTYSQAPGVTAGQINGLDSIQIQQLAPSVISFPITPSPFGLSTSTIQNLSPALLQSFNQSQIQGLTSTTLALLSKSQFQSLLPSQIDDLTQNQLANLSFTEVSWLTNSQLLGLTANQLAHLPSIQISWLSASQLTALNGQLVSFALTEAKSLTGQNSSLVKDINTLIADIVGNNNLSPWFNPINPNASEVLSWSAGFSIDASNFIRDYDHLYQSSQGSIGTSGSANNLTKLYQILATKDFIVTNSTNISNVTQYASNMFSWFTGFVNTMTPTAPLSDTTKLNNYIAQAYSILNSNIVGSTLTLSQDVSAFSNQINTLKTAVFDSIIGGTPPSDLMLWVINGAKGSTFKASDLASAGNISYRGQNNLTFHDALVNLESDLLTQGDNFCKNVQSGIAQVIHNKNIESQFTLISQIVDVMGGLFSGIAGIGKTISALGTDLSNGANALKAASEIASDLNAAIGVSKNQINNWKPSISAVSGRSEYNIDLAHIFDLNSLLSGNVPSSLINLQQTFQKDFLSLMSTMNNNLSSANDSLSGNIAWTNSTPSPYSVPFKDFFGKQHSVNADFNSIFTYSDLFNAGNHFKDAGFSVDGYMNTEWELTTAVTTSKGVSSWTHTVQLVGQNLLA